MNDLAVRRNVTSRLEDAEAVAERCLLRCDELLQAGKTLTGRIARLEDRLQALSEELEAAGRVTGYLAAWQRAHLRQTFLQRLRWVLRG